MGSMSIWHWIIVGGVLLLLFGGKGKVSDLMGDFAKGIKSFKKGMAEDDEAERKPAQPVTPVTSVGPEPMRVIDHRTPASTADDPTAPRRVG